MASALGVAWRPRSSRALTIALLYCRTSARGSRPRRVDLVRPLSQNKTIHCDTARRAYFGHVATPVTFLPVAVQFVGRWGLYRFVTHKFNIVPGHAYYDAFEDRKQPLELAAVLGGVAVACLA